MTEQEARNAIEAQGYRVISTYPRRVTVSKGSGSSERTFSGVSFRDLCQSFHLHERPA